MCDLEGSLWVDSVKAPAYRKEAWKNKWSESHGRDYPDEMAHCRWHEKPAMEIYKGKEGKSGYRTIGRHRSGHLFEDFSLLNGVQTRPLDRLEVWPNIAVP